VIRIDVHPAGENQTNTSRMLPTPVHVRPAYAFCGQSPYVATFHKSSIELSRPTAPEKKGSRHNPQRAADQSAGSYPASLPSQPMKQWGQSQASIYDRLLGLLAHITSMRSVRSILARGGPTERSLIDTGGGYNLGGAGLPDTTPRPPRPAVSPFP
jgi:hypothetical protein